MEPLIDQQQFESVIWRPEKPISTLFVVYFTANWCGACKRLNLDQIRASVQNPKVKFYKCDVDENEYTGGFCGVKSLPTFVVFHKGKVMDQLSNSNTATVISWLGDVVKMVNP